MAGEQISLIDLVDDLDRTDQRIVAMKPETGEVWTARRHHADDPKPVTLVGAERALLAACRAYDALWKDGVSPEERIRNGERLVRMWQGDAKLANSLAKLKAEHERLSVELDRAKADYEAVHAMVDGERWPQEPESIAYHAERKAYMERLRKTG